MKQQIEGIMNNFHNIKVSLFKPTIIDGKIVMGTSPETVELSLLLSFEHQADVTAKVRAAKDKSKRQMFKRELWAFTPSAIMERGRKAENIKHHTGLISFDIDNIGDNMDNYRSFIEKIPHIAYLGLSASGTGLWGLIPISDPEKHALHFDAMQKAFADCGIKIDPAPRAINSLRYVCYDKSHYFNPNAQIFDKTLEPVKTAKNAPISMEKTNTSDADNKEDGKVLGHWFNHNCSASDMDEILTVAGFNYHSSRGKSYRYTRPTKEVRGGLSVDYHEDRRTLYSFSSEVPFLDKWKREDNGWSCSPLTALLVYGCGGMDKSNWATAFQYIKSKKA